MSRAPAAPRPPVAELKASRRIKPAAPLPAVAAPPPVLAAPPTVPLPAAFAAPPEQPARPATPAALRVLVASHGHPAITRGGAEIAAYALYAGLREQPGVEAWFLGCRPGGGSASDRLGAAITQPFDEREFVYTTGTFEWFRFANRDPNFPRDFARMLAEIRPDVVHFHHFINFGVEAFEIVRRECPGARIVLTLHEYLAICHHYGQMVTKQRQNLCYRATLEDCNRCFPELGPAEFFMRSLYIKRFFALVDEFVAPSRFLAERFVEWGVPEARMHVIENVIAQPAASLAKPAAMADAARGALKVGFFGQISRLKGISVLFDAADLLERDDDASIVFDIHGSYDGQPPEFQTEFLDRMEKAGRNVRYLGRYAPERVDALMAACDVVLVPSIWWENSPVVIQEAFRNRRPVICSDIGGMAEKVRDGIDGWHFPVGSASGLVGLLRSLSGRDGIAKVSAGMQYPPAGEAIVESHRILYRNKAEANIETL